jgi:hypothetical protein
MNKFEAQRLNLKDLKSRVLLKSTREARQTMRTVSWNTWKSYENEAQSTTSASILRLFGHSTAPCLSSYTTTTPLDDLDS